MGIMCKIINTFSFATIQCRHKWNINRIQYEMKEKQIQDGIEINNKKVHATAINVVSSFTRSLLFADLFSD